MQQGLHARLIAVVVLLIIVTPVFLPSYSISAAAFEKDTHFYLTYFLALATCFEPDEALAIASGDLSVDVDEDVYPMPTASEIKRMILFNDPTPLLRYMQALERNHAMGDKKRVEQILFNMESDVYYSMIRNGPQRGVLYSFGIYLHAYQDQYSHEGYSRFLGHLIDSIRGRDPDSLAANQEKSKKMAFGTLEKMLKACDILQRQPKYLTSPKDPKLDALMDRLIKVSDPGWKKLDLGFIKRIFWGSGEDKQSTIFKSERNIINLEIAKIPGVGGAKIPLRFESVDIGRDGKIVKDSTGNPKVKASIADPEDLAIESLDYTASYTPSSKLRLEVNVAVLNAGDAPTASNLVTAALLMDSKENVLAAAYEEGPPLDYGERRTLSFELTADLSGVSFSNDSPLFLVVATSGGGEDPDSRDNIAIAPVTPQATPSAGPEGGATPPQNTTTVTMTSTVTITSLNTTEFYTTALYTTTTTQSIAGIPLDTRTIVIILGLLIAIALISRLLR